MGTQPASPSSVRLLDDHVINQIAAGEVIERPASVVKELLENAIDAGATSVEVVALDGGKRLIAVTDDGCGLSRDDALLSLERHATSKIRDVADIEQIATLGFRGEALAAIASVSRMVLTTRPAEEAGGTEVAVHGGTVQSVRDAGTPPGTRIEVRNLFYNVPARRKFLRAGSTELAHVRQVVMVHAMAHPGVAFRFTAEDRLIYEVPGGSTRLERVRELFSPELVRALLPLSYRDVDVAVDGFVGSPQTNRSDRSEQLVFVNGRAVRAPLIGHAIGEAYQATLPKGRHPVVVLFIDVDPAQVDVNVHPTKKEVRFRRPSQVRDGLVAGLREALQGKARGAGPESARAGGEGSGAPLGPEPLMPIRDLPLLEPFPYPKRSPADGGDVLVPGAEEPAGSDAPDAGYQAPWTWCRILGQVGGLYVVMETDAGLVLMDPQAAHERVLFEALLKRTDREAGKSQGLLVPETVALPPRAAEQVRRHADALRAMGFGLAEFGSDHFVIDGLPACLGEIPAEPVVREIAKALDTSGRGGAGASATQREAIARAACHAAVRARGGLQLAELEKLVTDLVRAEMPYTCPHGRPTMILQSFSEMDRKFGRR